MTQLSDAWVVFLDIYGFSSMIKTCEPDALHNTLLSVYEDIRHYMCNNTVLENYLYSFSDSIFIIFPCLDLGVKGDVLHGCIPTIRNILGLSIKKNLPMRGALAYGKVSYDTNLVVGYPVLNAYKYEQSLPCPLLFLPYRELEFTEYEKDDFQSEDIIIMKDGTPMAGILIPPFPIELLYETIKSNYKKYIMDGVPGPAKAWYEAKKYMDNQIGNINGYNNSR
jgi:hypothetical protein